jgi:hypothetical protein
MLKLRKEAEAELQKEIAGYGLRTFPLIVVAPNLQTGIRTLVQAFGIGPVKVNTILLNWLEAPTRGAMRLGELRYGQNLWAAFRFGCNIVILDAKEEKWTTLETLMPHERRIDVWWWGDATTRLMLLLAYLMTRTEAWEGAKIRVLAVSNEDGAQQTVEGLRTILEDVRIEAEPLVVKGGSDELVAESSNSAVVFVPFRLRRKQLMDPFDEPIQALIARLPVVAMVLAAEDIDLDAEPEEGKAGEIAEALDALAEAEERAKEAEKEAAESAKEADDRLHDMRHAVLAHEDGETMAKLEAAAREAREEAIRAARRAAKVLAKLEDAAKRVEALGAQPADTRKEMRDHAGSEMPEASVEDNGKQQE